MIIIIIIIYLCSKKDINIKYFDSHNAYIYVMNNNNDYIENMTTTNLIARKCKSKKELLNKYKLDAFDDITNFEKNIVNKNISIILNKIKYINNKYYKFLKKWLNKIYIAKSKSWLEFNMPHTYGNLIIMNNEWFIKPNIKVLIHELTHIQQRLYPNYFIKLYNELGYINTNITNIFQINELNRNNPDGININWIWKNFKNNEFWWCGVIFKSYNPNNLHDVIYIAIKINMYNNNLSLSNTIIFLNEFIDFLEFFGNYNDNYHPNEMCAMYSEWYLDEILNNNYYDYPGYNIYKNFMNNILSKNIF